MVGESPLVPQLEEQNVLNFDRSQIAVAFFLDLCPGDLSTLKQYYQRGIQNSVYMRMQNTMRVRQNDKYRVELEEEIGRLENRWVLPLAKATNIFESATRYTSVPPSAVKGATPNQGVELKAVEDTGIQDKTKWIEEPTVVQLKALGVRPYKVAMSRLQDLRHRRTQYRYLELYLFNIGRQIINLQANLRLVIAVIEVVEKARKILGSNLVDNPIGSVVQGIITSNDLDDAVSKLQDLKLDEILGNAGQGAAGSKGKEKPGDAASQQGQAQQAQNPQQSQDSGQQTTRGGATTASPSNPPSAGPTGVNTQQGTVKNDGFNAAAAYSLKGSGPSSL